MYGEFSTYPPSWLMAISYSHRGLSMYKHLRALGYTTLFANSFDEALTLYRRFPSLVSVVIRNMAGECHTNPQCVKSEQNPTGIPAWKIFDFEYFPSPDAGHWHAGLLLGKWILSANPQPGWEDRGGGDRLQYIGYVYLFSLNIRFWNNQKIGSRLKTSVHHSLLSLYLDDTTGSSCS